MNPNVNCGRRVIMMCQYRFITCKKCASLLGNIDNGVDHEHMEAGNIWVIFVHYAQYCCDNKTALKIYEKPQSFFPYLKSSAIV